MKIVRFAAPLVLSSALVFSAGSFAFAQTASQDMHAAGTDTKDAAKDVGHGVEHGTKHAYHATKRGTKKAYYKTKNGTKHVVHKSARATERTADRVGDKTSPATDTNPQ